MTVGLDSRCHIDLSGIVEEVKAQYDAIAARSLEEAEAYSRSQVRDHVQGETKRTRQEVTEVLWLWALRFSEE